MTLRGMEKESIRSFVESCSHLYARADVLDYGCGLFPYRDVVTGAGGDYWGFDDVSFPGAVAGKDPACVYSMGGSIEDLVSSHGRFEVVLCTQVVQYVPDPYRWLREIRDLIVAPGGHLVMTYPTNWPEVEEADRHRFTKSGMEMLLTGAGFTIERHERRAQIEWQGEAFALGYGVVARA